LHAAGNRQGPSFRRIFKKEIFPVVEMTARDGNSRCHRGKASYYNSLISFDKNLVFPRGIA
jgi:hypothetical protein